MPTPLRLSLVVSSSFAACLVFVTGCSSDSSDRPENAAIIVPDYPPAMTGTENFADGKIAVEVTLGLPSHFHPGKDGEHGGSNGGGRHAGGHRGGGRHGAGGMGGEGGYPGVEGSGETSHEIGDDDAPRPVVTGSTLPPAQLKLHLKNNSATEAVSCDVDDFNSGLGNFAVFPSAYQLAAGQSATSETMTSRLGVEGSEIPVTVALRVQGKVEKKVIILRQIPPPAPPAESEPAK